MASHVRALSPCARRAVHGVYRYGGPLAPAVDVALRRRRIARLLRAARRGAWTPKHGLERARLRSAAFRRERQARLRALCRELVAVHG